jgi:exopolyphosphatase/guanosine-5'-triphosphate,3'-diphosphate pyrophosphatase
MRFGVLDVGSNAAQLQVVDACAGAPPLPVHGVKLPTRLGEEVGTGGTISEEGVNRVRQRMREVANRVQWEGTLRGWS